MLIHTYFTDGFYKFGKIFLNSFKKFHGESNPIVLTTRNLESSQIIELKGIYNNIEIFNKDINIKDISKKVNIEVETLKKYKYQIEYQKIEGKNVIWKQYISVEDRYKTSILEAMKHNQGEKYMVHIDADSYFVKPIIPIFDVIEEHDISLIFRLNSSKENRKIFGAISGYRIGDKSYKFLGQWIKHINKIPLKRKPVGYGQTSCYRAYVDLKNSGIKWGSIPLKFVNSKFDEYSLIWSGNHSRGKIKTSNLFEKHLEEN